MVDRESTNNRAPVLSPHRLSEYTAEHPLHALLLHGDLVHRLTLLIRRRPSLRLVLCLFARLCSTTTCTTCSFIRSFLPRSAFVENSGQFNITQILPLFVLRPCDLVPQSRLMCLSLVRWEGRVLVVTLGEDWTVGLTDLFTQHLPLESTQILHRPDIVSPAGLSVS